MAGCECAGCYLSSEFFVISYREVFHLCACLSLGILGDALALGLALSYL